MSEVIHLTTGAFPKVMAQGSPVLIDFWAPWCAPCRMQGPILDEVAKGTGDKAIVAKVNVDQGPAWKRIRPAPMGRAFRILKRTSHVHVYLAERKGR